MCLIELETDGFLFILLNRDSFSELYESLRPAYLLIFILHLASIKVD